MAANWECENSRAASDGVFLGSDEEISTFFLFGFLPSPFSLFFFFYFCTSSFAARWVTSGRFRGGARRRVRRELYDARVRRSGQTSVKSRLSLRLCVTHKGVHARTFFARVRDREHREARLQRLRELPAYSHRYTQAHACTTRTREREREERREVRHGRNEPLCALPNAHYPHRPSYIAS